MDVSYLLSLFQFFFFYILFIFSYYVHSVEFCTFKFPTYKCMKFRSLLIRFVRKIIDIESGTVVTTTRTEKMIVNYDT